MKTLDSLRRAYLHQIEVAAAQERARAHYMARYGIRGDGRSNAEIDADIRQAAKAERELALRLRADDIESRLRSL